MGEVVNLRRVRRRRDRHAAGQEADANRARFGRTADEKRRDELDAGRRDAVLDGARIEREPDAD
ncbi:DUF4169 family protein [Rhizosaccharibacter radicis]|uniref:DUF4169 family protein n=1 Tax=Rhizosaccharibacter radicis TaxID=2782605 RepID=A0ABT1VVS5_9PROT|nr:DUF4169 family protein [Acetobacteraceae bacterium KSS12]